jgi:hypothetical protein
MSQSIDFSAVADATFNGSTVEQINLNGSEIWAKSLGVTVSPLGGEARRTSHAASYLIPFVYVHTNGDIYTMFGSWNNTNWNSPAYTDAITGSQTLNGRLVSQYPLISFDENGLLKQQPVQKYDMREYDGYGNILISHLVATTNAAAQTLHINRSPNSFFGFGDNYANGSATYTWDAASKSFSVVGVQSNTNWQQPLLTSFPNNPALTFS